MGKKIDPNQKAEIDDRTNAMLLRKGYQVQTAIGKGSYGDVYKALRFGQLCAVKIMNLDAMSAKFKNKFLPRELASLMELRHPNIVRVLDIFRSNRKIYVFMEYASNGELGDYMKKYGILSEDRAHTWFSQVTGAINYLHEEMFTAHRDIKIDNVLLDEHWVPKVTDFGFATEAVDNEGYTLLSETYCGTRPYYPPQILQKKPYDPFKADVWALGVLLFAMVHNRFPFHHKDPKLQLREMEDLEYRKARLSRQLSPELKALLLAMLEPNEEKRLSCTEVLEHPWILLRQKLVDG